MTVEDENRLQKKVYELKTKNEDSKYIIEGKLREKENQMELMRQRDSENTDVIAALSDQLSRVMDEIAKIRRRN